MHGNVAVFLLAPLEERELGHPEEIETVLIDQAQLFSKLQTKAAQHVVDHGVLIRSEKKQVSLLSFHGRHKSIQLLFGHELGEGGLIGAVRLYAQIGKPLRAVSPGEFHQSVDLLSRHAGLSLHVDAAHGTTRFQGGGEHAESAALHHLGHIL